MALPDPNDAADVADVADVADAFLEQSYLTYIIPFATAFSPEEALGQGTGAGAAPGAIEAAISSIEQRDQLFFGTRSAPCRPRLAPTCLRPPPR